MYGASGYDEIIGALDELEALDARAGDEYIGDEYVGDEYVGDEYVGDMVSVGDHELEAIAGYHRHRRHPHHAFAGYDEIIGADADLATLMAAAGAAPAHHHRRVRMRHPHMMPRPIMHAPPMPHPMAAPPAHHHHYHPHPHHHHPAHPALHPSRLAELAARLTEARKVDPSAVAVVDRPQDRRREFPVGLVAPGPTAPGTSAQAVAFPQVTFRPERLVIPSQIAPFFTIDAIIVGKDNQSVSFDPLPATMFSEVGVGVRLNLKTAIVGMQIIVRFTNVDPLQQTRTFSGGIIGTAVE
jgi:hypothetical protein